jgi:hypothetical protein
MYPWMSASSWCCSFRMILHRIAGFGVFYSVHIPAVEAGHNVRLGEMYWGPAIFVGVCVAMEVGPFRGVVVEGRDEDIKHWGSGPVCFLVAMIVSRWVFHREQIVAGRVVVIM